MPQCLLLISSAFIEPTPISRVRGSGPGTFWTTSSAFAHSRRPGRRWICGRSPGRRLARRSSIRTGTSAKAPEQFSASHRVLHRDDLRVRVLHFVPGVEPGRGPDQAGVGDEAHPVAPLVEAAGLGERVDVVGPVGAVGAGTYRSAPDGRAAEGAALRAVGRAGLLDPELLARACSGGTRRSASRVVSRSPRDAVRGSRPGRA